MMLLLRLQQVHQLSELLAPAKPASLTALRSTLVTPLGIPITILGATIPLAFVAFLNKCFYICSAASKSAITPSLSGLTALILPGVLQALTLLLYQQPMESLLLNP